MNNAENWYQMLIRPDWAPPAWLFGPVWTVLYALIAISFGYVFLKIAKKELPIMFGLPFVLNLIFNFAFSPLQFSLQSNILAAIDIILVLGTLIWLIVASWNKVRWVALINIPYLLWVSFATVLQITITVTNF
jgi:tryptophan-rich sensory protein